MSDFKLTKSRQYLLLVVGVFVLPIILAKLALVDKWFDYGVTNQGELVSNELTLQDLGLTSDQFDKQWLMLVNLPNQCDELCQSTLLVINNAFVLLGQDIPRVTPVVLTKTKATDKTLEAMHHSKWQSVLLPEATNEQLAHQQLLIVDPLNNVVLSYQLPTDKDKVALLGNAIVSDMKKLLKYSRIG
ncbi:hypothetical protein [Thalassotalea piscium]|uniref:Cytochrome oxidase assembly protein n=1 Tax=Thalassotalea piscium TaxID=1230533 RepID=A0A7X0TT65_9GAMM|nr:hypothetical protein [Thalassotalea piscium]MBB6542833.1 hypothetical protein [Thalassotalea piscium]